jgi:DegV family protein with EDD domain
MPENGFLDGTQLRGALVSACDYVQAQRAELNRINVFPVPDGDTGTNLALTAASIADHLRGRTDASVGAVARDAAEGAVLGARGNCGMILSHFLLGFADAVGARERLSVPEFAGALRGAVEHVYRALERPVEGTIITIMRAVAEQAEKLPGADFTQLMPEILEAAKEALARTPDLLPALRAAGVVDAGAKGFVHLIEGITAYMAGDPLTAVEGPVSSAPSPFAAAAATYPTESERYRFCTEALVRGDGIPDSDAIRGVMRQRGDSLVVIRTGELLKVHIHTDEPEGVFDYLRTLGELAAHKAEDMQAQHEAVERAAAAGHLQLARRTAVIVTDSAGDLPDDVLRAHGIYRVPLNLIFDDQVLRDGVDITPAQFLERLRAGAHPTTSQPAPGAFAEAFRRAARDGEGIVAVMLGSALSGTFASAEAAAKLFTEVPIHVVDSGRASLSQGMLALRAAELVEEGWSAERIVPELLRIRGRSGLLFTLENYDRLLASGRVGRGRALLGTLLDIKPILSIDEQGKVTPAARVRGSRNVLPRVLEIVEAALPKGAERVRFGIIQIAAEEIAAEVADALRQRFGARDIMITPATPVIATHTGPGTWGVAWQVED